MKSAGAPVLGSAPALPGHQEVLCLAHQNIDAVADDADDDNADDNDVGQLELGRCDDHLTSALLSRDKFQLTDIVIVGIIIIGIIGYGIDILMRKAENRLIPWKGKG